MALFTSAPNALCILRLSAIGDVCNAIAAVQAIEKQWPTTKITWIAGKAEAALLTPLLPNVQVISFDKKQGVKGMLTIWKTLKHIHFDALLHMQTAIRASLISLGIKATYRLGFDKERVSDLQQFFTNIKVPSPNSPHVLDGFMAFTHTLGIAPVAPSWEITLSDQDAEWAKATLGESPSVILAPAASKAFKNWTIDGYVGLVEHMHAQGFRVFLVGGPSPLEIEIGAQIETKANVPVDNLIGKTSLLQLIALEKFTQVVIAPDSGPAHLANAVNTPVMGLYAHHNPARTGPYNWRNYVVSAYEKGIQQEHPDTTNLPWRTRVKNPDAMQKITLEQVITRFDEIIEKEGLMS